MQTWDLDSLSLRQRDVLSLVCDTNSGAVCLDTDAPNFRLQLKAARELHALGIVEVHPPQSQYRDEDEVTVLLTADGEAWLLSLPEGSLAQLPE